MPSTIQTHLFFTADLVSVQVHPFHYLFSCRVAHSAGSLRFPLSLSQHTYTENQHTNKSGCWWWCWWWWWSSSSRKTIAYHIVRQPDGPIPLSCLSRVDDVRVPLRLVRDLITERLSRRPLSTHHFTRYTDYMGPLFSWGFLALIFFSLLALIIVSFAHVLDL